MVPLQHRQPEPAALTQFNQQHPNATVKDFDGDVFRPVKRIVRKALNQDQGGLCVYCERPLAADGGQLEHIKPKSGFPGLCFTFTNYAHSCIHPKTCGQSKRDRQLPVEPGPGCNSEWALSLDGSVQPLGQLNRKRRQQVVQTRDMLGLNADSALVADRRDSVRGALEILRQDPSQFPAFLQNQPFRHILATLT